MREIRGRMETIVARIIVGEIPFFKDQFENTVDRHLRHKFWRGSSQQSNVKISRFIWKHSDTYTSVTRDHFLNNIYIQDMTEWTYDEK